MLKHLPASIWLRRSRWSPRSALGHLERDVMDVLWAGEFLSVRDVRARLGRTVAYTTVMTTLDRLFKKGLVDRRLERRAYQYTATLARDEMEARLTSRLLADALAATPAAAQPFLSNLVDVVGDRDDQLLDDLERLVREKRERIRRGGS